MIELNPKSEIRECEVRSAYRSAKREVRNAHRTSHIDMHFARRTFALRIYSVIWCLALGIYLASSAQALLDSKHLTGQADVSSLSYYSHLDAGEEGTFNIGLALGGVVRSFDEDVDKHVLKFDYWASTGTFVGVWTKDYPPRLGRVTVDAVRIGVKVPDPGQLQQVCVKLEIKGTKAKQDIPLHLEAGWNYIRETIAWNTIGNLREIVFVVSPMSVGPKGTNPILFSPVEAGPTDVSERVEGLLYFALDFYKLTFLQKNFIFVKIGLIFVISFLAAWVVGILGKRR